ncbi:MAG: peptide-methionine (S)-S-oxide reductase MsrA, partial [Xanthomonadales bacterium]|nr:peptide-methionine (S)-S-oxide reductase MsrA [Xanthomonadales bacterium]
YSADSDRPAGPPPNAENLETAYFAGGCFWCTESDFESVPGVAEAISGYAGGHVDNPSYEAVSADRTGHLETVEVLYDTEKVTYEELLDVFWHSVDPTDDGGQFCDRGSSYRTAVFAADAAQREKAEASKEEIERTKPFDAPIVTPIRDLEKFWPAEDYHQDFYETHTIRYKTYRTGCGRDARLRDLWGDEAYLH